MRAAIYLRISRDPEGLELGVKRQLEDLQKLAEASKLIVAKVYKDNDISASTRSTKNRPEFNQMIKDAKGGKFETIVAYTSSRLTRKPRENEDLIELAEKHRITFRYLRSPAFDLNTADGRNVARILAANDAAESERISERVSRAVAQRARSGQHHGGARPWGYEQDSNSRVIDPEQARLIKEGAARLLSGETLYGVCSSWNARDERTSTGSIWRSKTLKRAITNPALIGKRAYEGKLYDGAWPPILDEITFDRLCVLLSDESRKIRDWVGHDTSRKHALSGLCRCGTCGKVLASMTARRNPDGSQGPRSFFCSKMATGGCGSLRILMPQLEEWVLAQIISTLAELPMPETILAESEESNLRNKIAQDEDILKQITTDHYDRVIDRPTFLDQRRRISARLDDNRRKLSEITIDSVRSVIPSGSALAEQWPHQDAMWKRTMAASIIDHITISKLPKGTPTTYTHRRNESDGSLAARREELMTANMLKRVHITWRV